MLNWKEISAEEAEADPNYGFGGWLMVFYVLIVLWCLHGAWTLLFDPDLSLTRSYGYTNLKIIKLSSFFQILFALPFLYLVVRRQHIMPSVGIACFSTNWMAWFALGMIVPEAPLPSIVVSVLTLVIILYLRRSNRVNVTFLSRRLA